MKKSRSIRLVLLGSASFALAACGDNGPPKDARFFSNIQDCSAVYDVSTCIDAQKQSEQAFLAEAPKFSRREECEAQFGAGNCETRETAAGGGSFVMPMLMGYMLGNALGGSRFNQPVYRGPNNTAVMPNRGRLYNIGNFAVVGRSTASFRPAAQITSIQRGGFGSTAMAFRGSAGS